MRSKFLLFVGGAVMLSSSAMAGMVTCQSILSVGNGNFGELETAGSCDIGNVTFSGFNTTFNPLSVVVATNGFAGSPVGSILGLTYSFLAGTFPGGSIGYTATYDPLASTDGAGGTACPVTETACGITGVESQLNSGVPIPNAAAVTTVYTGGYVGSSVVDALTLADETYQTLTPIVIVPLGITKVATYNGLGTADTFSTEVITGGVATPEPATLTLVGGALLALGVLRRRKASRA
jgi:hypothetical protein